MREFIGNPFEQDYDDEDNVIDEIQGFGGEVRLQLENDQLIIVDFINRGAQDDDYLEDDTDHASEESEYLPDVENENTDYDSDYLPENDGYDPDAEFGNDDCDVILGEQNLSFSSDEDDDEELDYVTYPIAEDKNTAPTSNSENTES